VSTAEPWFERPDFRLRSMLRRLAVGGVDFVVIGGVAVILQAAPRLTKDLDICYAPERANLERLAAVLIELDAKLRGIDEDLPFLPDARALSQTQILTLATAEGGIDLLVDPAGSPGYAALRRRARKVELEGLAVRIASIEDLIAMKRAAGRPQDLVDLESLEIARRRTRRQRLRS